MTANPFIYAEPLPPGRLIDRIDEVAELLSRAEGGHNSRLSAPRRYGKTTVLRETLRQAENAALNTVYVDFYRAVTVGEISRRMEEAYLAGLAGPVRRAVGSLLRSWGFRERAGVGGVGVEAEHSPASEEHLARLLDLPKTVFERSGKRTLVVFDEFQDFLRAEGEIDGLIRSKIQFHVDEASYIFAGSEPGLLSALFADRRRPLFDQARPVQLGPLEDGALGNHIAELFASTRRDVGAALDPLLDLVRGHPQRAMLLAHHVWELTPNGEVADAETLTLALDGVMSELKEGFEHLWQRLSRAPNQRRVLLALARGDASLYGARTLQQFSMEKGGVQSGLAGLREFGEVQGGNGQPTIVDPLLELWLREP